MKRILALVTLLVAVVSISVGQEKAQKEKTKEKEKAKGEKMAAPSSTEMAVRQLFDEVAAAYAKNDATVLARVYADDLTMTNPLGQVLTKQQRLDAIKPGGIHFDSYTADDVMVRVYGDTAVVTSKATVTGKRGDQDISGQYRATTVFIKKGGQWQIIAAQSTRIAETPPN